MHACEHIDQMSTKIKPLKAMSLIKSAVSGAQLMSNKNVAKQHIRTLDPQHNCCTVVGIKKKCCCKSKK